MLNSKFEKEIEKLRKIKEKAREFVINHEAIKQIHVTITGQMVIDKLNSYFALAKILDIESNINRHGY